MHFSQDAQKLGSFDITNLKLAVASILEDDWNADQSRQSSFNAHIRTQTIKLIADSDFRHTNPTYHPFFAFFEPHLSPLMAHIRNFYL